MTYNWRIDNQEVSIRHFLQDCVKSPNTSIEYLLWAFETEILPRASIPHYQGYVYTLRWIVECRIECMK